MSFTLKYEGDKINELLDKAETALQEHQDISHLATKDELSDGLNKKQDIIEDLDSIRENASKGTTALQSVPSEYVTESELEQKGFLTEIPDEYVTESELNEKGYLTEHQSLAHLATKIELDGKVDKIIGKQLSTEDFTTLLKEKLESLKNYDDAALVSRIDAIQETIDTLFSKDASSAIESFNEIIAFLEGIEDSQSLDNIIASIEQQIADVAKAIPTKVSELDNDEGYLTEHQDVSGKLDKTEAISTYLTKADAQTTYLGINGKAKSAELADKATQATKATQDAAGRNLTVTYATKAELYKKQNTISDLETIRSGAALGATAIQEHQDISGKANKSDIPTKVSQLTNDSNFQTETEVFGTVLYNVDVANTNYGAVTLSDSTANYEFVDFYAATNDKHVFFNRVYQPNGKKIVFSGTFVGNTSLFLKAKVYECNGNKLTTAKGTNDLVWAGEWGSEKNSLARGENTVGIWRVVGYKR